MSWYTIEAAAARGPSRPVWDEWLAAGECTGVSASEPLACTFTPEAPGSYRLTATIRDTRDRPHTTVLSTWVIGKGQLVWRSGNDDALEIVPEQAAYEVGDTARYLLKNPYAGARALVTIERYGVLKQWVQTLEGSTPVVEFGVEKDFLPGFYLSVLVMSPPAVMDGWLDDDRGRVLVDGAGHWVQQEAPEPVNAALLTFLHGVHAT